MRNGLIYPKRRGRGSGAYILELIRSTHSTVPCLATQSLLLHKDRRKTVNVSIFQENQ
jgi:hypothetical protein